MMEPLVLSALLASCAPQVHPSTAAAIVATESDAQPYAIGVVGGQLLRQPQALGEAVTTASALQASGWNFSIGLAQINLHNLPSLGLTLRDAFDPCINLAAMQSLLADCYRRAGPSTPHRSVASPKDQSSDDQPALRDALSCYYSGNFVTGHRQGYVARVLRNARQPLSTRAALTMPVAFRPP